MKRRIAVAAFILFGGVLLDGNVAQTSTASIARTASINSNVVGCGANIPDRIDLPQSTREFISVVSPFRSATRGTLQRWVRVGSCFRGVGGAIEAELGESGLSSSKHEGDGTTPIGLFTIGTTIYGISPNPGVAFAYHRLVCGDWWDEDPRSTAYNSFVHVPCGVRPLFGGGSEALWRVTPQYDYFALIDYNVAPVKRGRGSAIFLHVSDGNPTLGCVAIDRSDLVVLLRWLSPQARPEIAIDTTAAISSI